MTILRTVPLLLLLLGGGCINVNVQLGDDSSEPVTYWEIDYPLPESSPLRFDTVIRVRDFSASSICEMTNMVLRLSDGSVAKSTTSRWNTRPSSALSALLTRDLVAEGTYTAVFLQTSVISDRLVVDGYVREFGAMEVDSITWLAVLDIDVSLLSDRCTEVVFQKNYRIEHRMSGEGYEILARELSMLTEIWSEMVRGDIVSAQLPRR